MVETTAIALIFCGSAMIVCGIARTAAHTMMIAVASLSMTAGAVITSSIIRYYQPQIQSDHVFLIGREMPSVATIICITLYAMGMTYRTAATAWEIRCTVSRVIGWVIVAASSLAVFGHWFNAPWAFYYSPLTSTGMALSTSVALLALGLGMVVLPTTKR